MSNSIQEAVDTLKLPYSLTFGGYNSFVEHHQSEADLCIGENSSEEEVQEEIDSLETTSQWLEEQIDNLRDEADKLESSKAEIDKYIEGLNEVKEAIDNFEVTVEISITAKTKEEFLRMAEEEWDREAG